MSVAGTALLLAIFAVQGPFAQAQEPRWSGTVTLERSFEYAENRVDDGQGSMGLSCSWSEQVRNKYRATAKLRPGSEEAKAEISASGLMEKTETCSGNVTCGGTLLQPGTSRPTSRNSKDLIESSGSGSGTALVTVEFDGDGGYTVQVEFPSIEDGTQRLEHSSRVTGGCAPEEPEGVTASDLVWIIAAESARGEGRVGIDGGHYLRGEQQIDENTTLRWDLRQQTKMCKEPMEVTWMEGTAFERGNPIKVGNLVQNDTVLSTGPNGKLEVTFGDGSTMRLGPGSKVTVRCEDMEANRGKFNLSLTLGRIWAKVSRSMGGDDHFNVNTQRSVTGNRGTEFAVISDARRDTVKVQEGAVETRPILGGRPLLIKACEAATLADNEPLHKIPLVADEDIQGCQ